MSTTNTSTINPHAVAAATPKTESSHVGMSWPRFQRSAFYVGLASLALVVLADVLFYRQVLGWTPAAFAFALAAAVIIRRPGALMQRHTIILCVAILGLCLALVDHPSPLRIAMMLLALLSLSVITARGWTSSVPHWLARWSEIAARGFVQLPLDIAISHRWRTKHGGRFSPPTRALLNWFVPALLSVIFIALFAVANPIISSWVEQGRSAMATFFSDVGAYVSFGRIVLWIAVAMASWALLRGRTKMREANEATVNAATNGLIAAPLLIRCLILFNVVFAVQMTLDLITVVSQGATLPEGMSYSEYARRGAYPLVATALLAAGFVLVTFPSTSSQATTSPAMRWARRLVYIWIGQNILLTISAAWRLQMYVEAFGLTRLRLAAAIWMLLVALGLAFIIWRLAQHRSNAWLMRINAVTALAVLYVCCFINFDGFIASYRKEHCFELRGVGPRIDLRYLASLGPEAIPTLDWYEAQLAADHPVGRRSGELAAGLREELNGQLQTWQGWTWRRARLAD